MWQRQHSFQRKEERREKKQWSLVRACPWPWQASFHPWIENSITQKQYFYFFFSNRVWWRTVSKQFIKKMITMTTHNGSFVVSLTNPSAFTFHFCCLSFFLVIYYTFFPKRRGGNQRKICSKELGWICMQILRSGGTTTSLPCDHLCMQTDFVQRGAQNTKTFFNCLLD